jgi:ribulose-bisphosphate carboxylase small chain
MSVDPRQFACRVRLGEADIRRRLRDCQRHGWALVIEHSRDANPQNAYWDRWGSPIWDPEDPGIAMLELAACRAAFPLHYIRVNACERGRGQPLIRDTLLVHSPESPGGIPN